MRFRTLKLLRRRKRARQQMEKTHKWIRYVTIFLFCCLLLAVSGCENVRHKIGISTKPFQSGESFENSTKLNYTIIFGKVRPKEDDD